MNIIDKHLKAHLCRTTLTETETESYLLYN